MILWPSDRSGGTPSGGTLVHIGFGVDERFWAVVEEAWYALLQISEALSNPLIAAGVVLGAVALGAGGWFAAVRCGWRPVPSVLAGISLGVVLGVTFSRTLPDWAGRDQFCQLNGFSLNGSAELLNALLFVPLVFCAVLATRRPLAVAVSGVALSAVIEIVQPLTRRGLCETQDFLNNSAGAVVAAALAAGVVVLERRRRAVAR
ncbi:VanZ like family protein [Lentzea fradiae]|uniref:VanZ like family protein n=1 Tax=Lentzea fradiae TaxID=200378 RepID=A0A1G7QZF8_9PSEU|nr:VanZ family protein [Lentzea fradiae]SDG03912.1 VanZ like family protein [Lentzea fradiae]